MTLQKRRIDLCGRVHEMMMMTAGIDENLFWDDTFSKQGRKDNSLIILRIKIDSDT